MLCKRLYLAVPIALLMAALAAAGAASAGDAAWEYLNHTLNWYREADSLDPTPIGPQDAVRQEAVRKNARQSLKLGFDIARAQAAELESATTRPTSAPASSAGVRGRNLSATAETNAQHISQLQEQINELTKQVAQAPPEQAPLLIAKRDKLVSELNFAQTRQHAIENYVSFMSGLDSSGPANLFQRIDELERSIPGLQPASSTDTSAGAASTAQPLRPEAVGAIGLIEQLFTLTGRMSEMGRMITRTHQLEDANDKLRSPLRAQLQDALQKGEAISKAPPTEDAAALASQRQQLDVLNDRLKQLAAVAVPLGEQRASLEATANAINEWRTALGRESVRLLRSLLIRLGIIAGIIFLLLVISSVWGRLALRYVSDIRRRRQFLLLRRIIVGSIIIVVIIAGVVAEIGSLATFAGLITAGIAVALQSVILSGCAYFFFLGRYGVRVGDRLTISGITGDVIDIGLFRLYLMELAGGSRDQAATGRIVVFSNSVLFQPNAFFKQFPGADYAWHEVALTLSPETDHRLAEQRLLGAVESVYAGYRESIEKQYEAIKDKMHLPIAVPRPIGHLRLVEAGLEYAIRYPVDIHRASETDDRITRKLLETIEQEPRLKLVPSGTPRIQPADQQPPQPGPK